LSETGFHFVSVLWPHSSLHHDMGICCFILKDSGKL
jgi:hypothetical protein